MKNNLFDIVKTYYLDTQISKEFRRYKNIPEIYEISYDRLS